MDKYEVMQVQDDEQYSKYFSECRSNKVHHIDISKLRQHCFNITNTFYAHEGILRSKRPTADDEYCIQRNWHINFHNYISSYLLDLAIGIRTLEDALDETFPKLTKEDNESIWFCADDIKDKTLREACNKIIHATSFSYILDKLDSEVFAEDVDEDDYVPQPSFRLSGLIELSGKKNTKEWNVIIDVLELISSTLKLLPQCEQLISTA